MRTLGGGAGSIRTAMAPLGWVLSIAVAAAPGCGDIVPTASGDDAGTGTTDAEADPPPCPGRFSERVDGGCVPVTVTSFEEIPVEVPVGDDLRLPGILTRPVTPGDYVAPGVVIQTGPGPSNADHHVSGELRIQYNIEIPVHAHLAEELARGGVAVLRHDSRTCFAEENDRCVTPRESYPGDPQAAIADDYADDGAAAARWLAARPEVRDLDVTIVGQSYGGVYAPALALREEVISGGVLLGTPSMSFADTVAIPYEQWADDVEAEQGADSPEAQQLRAQAAELRRVLGEIEDGTYTSDTFADKPVAFWRNQIDWHNRIQATFLEAAAAEPFLVLQGELDSELPYEHIERYGTWAAEATIDHNVVPVILRDSGHWLVRIAAGQAESRLSPEVAGLILGWMRPQE